MSRRSSPHAIVMAMERSRLRASSVSEGDKRWRRPTATLRITLTGGPTALLEASGFRVLTDPTFDPPGQYQLAHTTLIKTAGPALTPEAVGKIDAVLLSHDQHPDKRWPSASTAANAVAFSTGTLLQRRLCTSGPSVSGPEISGPEISGPEISGPERATGRQASGLPPSFTLKPSPSGDGSSPS